MIFTLLERLMIPGLLPREGSYLDMVTADNLLQMVRFPPEEMERARDHEGLNLRPNEAGGMVWEQEFAEDFSLVVDLKVDQANLLRRILKELNDAKKLPRDCLSLYRKIVESDLSVEAKEASKLAEPYNTKLRTAVDDILETEQDPESKPPLSIFKKPDPDNDDQNR